MNRTMTSCIAALVASGAVSTHAASIVATDGDGNVYGDAAGLAIDFDSSSATLADWTPDLVAGLSYSLNSVSVRYGSTELVADDKYLGVYTGFTSGILSGFLGASVNAIDFTSATPGSWQQFNFSGINLTVDSTVGSGSGLLYFVYQTSAADRSGQGTETTVQTQRFNGETGNMAATLSSILAFGTAQATRSPEYQATLTPVPEPSAFALAGLSAAALLARRRSR